jgi:phospholipid/cholesterol/gamma-HCH transport system substrate-binding protein
VNREARERAAKLRVGIFVAAGVVAFIAVVYLLGARARLFETHATIHADFTEVGGLVEGATVRLAGVQIGRVRRVNLPSEPGGKVRVDMQIGKRFTDRVRKDSIARIDTQGLLGDKIIELTVGTPAAPPVRTGDVIAGRDPADFGQIVGQGAETVKNVSALAESLRTTAEALGRSKLIEDTSATLGAARRAADEIARGATVAIGEIRGVTARLGRITDQVEKGPGWAHVLLYEEPVALRQLGQLIASTQALLDRTARGEGAIGVFTSEQSTAAARRLVVAMDKLGQAADRPDGSEGLLPGLLFDPKYKPVLEDLRVVTRNLRDVSERVAGGKGTLGELVRDDPAGGIREASRDLQATLANLREITDKVKEGEGTIGALIEDPTVYERLVSILDGAQRSFLLRGLLRGLGGGRPRDDGAGSSAPERRGPRE